MTTLTKFKKILFNGISNSQIGAYSSKHVKIIHNT